jgi:hypothetical protein
VTRALVAVALVIAACGDVQTVGDVRGVLFGIAAATNTSDEATQEAAMIATEAKVTRHFDLDRIYRQWDTAIPGAREQWTIAQSRTPIVSFKASSDAPWPAIAAGTHDRELAEIAAGFAALRVPVFAIFDQDPENSGGALGTPADYREAYRHVVAVFRTTAAHNVVWIFNLKSPSFADLADAYYPGDDAVDWIGASVYNFGIASGGRWVSFADLITDYLVWATPHGKPMIITEWASNEDPDVPGRKAAWIDAAAATVHATPQLRAVSGFWSQGEDKAFDSSDSALAAFRAFAADPYTHLRDAPH